MSIRARVLSATLALIAAAPVAAAAQTPMTFGIKAGVNSSTVKDQDNSNIGRLLGGIGGVAIGGNLTNGIGLQVEGLYSQRGAKDESESPEFKLRTTYIDVPVTLSMGSGSGSTRFNVFTGPQVSFLLSAKASANGVDVDIKNELENIDLGWTLGAGALLSDKFTVDARYTHGLKNMAKADLSEDSEVKNRTFSVMFGIRLR
jgi:opacity protein-like surface antigen